jgi:hypothetical protein
MLIRKWYVPGDFSFNGKLSAYLLWWPTGQDITIRVTLPDLMRIVDVFNAVPKPGCREFEPVFSRFRIPGYLGLMFEISPGCEIPEMVTLGFEIETGLGLSEVYEKTITLPPVGEDTSPPYPKICRSWDTGGFAVVPDVPGDAPATLPEQRRQEERSIISSVFEQVFRKTDRISTDLGDEFRIEGRALTILCPERKLKYDQIISPKNSWPLPKTVKFTSVVPSRVEITNVPSLVPVPEAVVYTDDGYKIKLNFLKADERYLLSLEYDFKDFHCLSRLIQHGCSVKPPCNSYDRSITCEICALLKYPDILAMGGYAVTLRDYEISIDIPLQGKTASPESPGGQKGYDSPENSPVLSTGLSLFRSASELRKFIEVQKDFSYLSAQLFCDGAAYSTGTILQSSVKITVRTDLSLAQPAADGSVSLRYRDQFLKI